VRSVIGGALKDGAGDPDPVGDLVLTHRLVLFADADPSRALVEPDRSDDGLDTPCHLTGPGRRVLDGRDAALASAWARHWLPPTV
jgi:hypothetical protein